MPRIFDVSSSTGLGIEGYLTCWKDELGNHTLGIFPSLVWADQAMVPGFGAQNMHQLGVFGAK